MKKTDIEKIYKVTLCNNGSSYIKDNQYETLRKQNGYIVGGFSKCIKTNTSYDNFSKAITKIDKMLERGDILGTWINEGMIYIEKSKVIEDLDFALEIARLNNQLAIYDNVEQNEIKV